MAETESETKLCGNCKKQISSNNFVMHEMHCKRHISLCKHCNEPIPRNEMDVHFEENHAMMTCPKCKVQIEKMQFEDHEENDCPKKPMHCLYCELEFPKDELEAHLDYCGSRTEPCSKCGQFIMLKEQIKHDESNCKFPEVKPKNNNVADGNVRRNPFEFEDFTRNIGGHDIFTDFVPSTEVSYSAMRPRGRQAHVTRQPVKTNNRKPDVNKRSVGAADRASEYDRLLAMHLAQDLGHQDEDLDDIVRNFDKPSSLSVQNQYGTNAFPTDSVMIPCEFCGELVNVDDLVQHQSGCSLDRISSMLPQMTSNNHQSTNNYSPISEGNPGQPTIIDNLRHYGADEWLDDTAVPTGYDGPSENEDLLLPCEFCCELFPMDSLVQHQAMCDRMTMTPLPPTPPEERRSNPVSRSSKTNYHRLENEFPNLSSRYSGFNDYSDDDGSTRVAHTVQKPKPKSSVKNGITKNEVASPSREIRSTLRKYGVESVDRGDDYTRQSGLSRQNSDNSTDSWLNPSSTNVQKRLPSSSHAQKRSSVTDPRSTLDNLLNDHDQRSSHDLLSHIGGSQARKRETNPGVRQKVSVQPGVTRSTARVKTSTTAKDVQRELTRAPNSSSSSNGLPSRNRTSRPGFEVRVRPSEADETSDIVSGQRRTRANVFGGSSNKSTSRRPSNR